MRASCAARSFFQLLIGYSGIEKVDDVFNSVGMLVHGNGFCPSTTYSRQVPLLTKPANAHGTHRQVRWPCDFRYSFFVAVACIEKPAKARKKKSGPCRCPAGSTNGDQQQAIMAMKSWTRALLCATTTDGHFC